MGSKSGFTPSELDEIKRLYIDEGRSVTQIPRILGKGSESSVRNALKKVAKQNSTQERKKLERFQAGQVFGKITLIKQLKKSKKLKYHVACDCGYEFDVDPYLLSLPDDHKDKIAQCPQCRMRRSAPCD